MTITFSENDATLQIKLSETALLNCSGRMKTFLDAYCNLCEEISNSDIAETTIGTKIFRNKLLAIKIEPE